MIGPLTQLGRYEIVDKIAAGGMATVYLARMQGPQGFSKIVALKLMHPHLAEDEHHVVMFMDEGRLSARFTHPNLVSVFDYGELDAYRFMAMEYHHGLTLAHLWKHLRAKKEPMSLALTLHILRETLQGLDYAHNLQDEEGSPLEIIHRDVSPENILLTTQGSVKVLDFGIALDNARRAVSRTGIVKGKISYMSPEQVTGKALDRRTDIYATAVMAYELISGKHLFGDGSTEEIRRRIQNSTKLPIKKGDLPNAQMDALLRAALAHNPDERYKTASCFKDAVDKVIQDNGWQVEEGALASLVQGSKEAIEKEAKKKHERERAAKLRKQSRDPQTPKVSGSGGLSISWFARASVALLGVALLLELFGVTVELTGPVQPAEAAVESHEFNENLEATTEAEELQTSIAKKP